ncbi:MAG TPA: hypothetical protein VMT20_27550 [Terriglobia bacterium]|nr:hypothetical protein [Terriglobia bacterium]
MTLAAALSGWDTTILFADTEETVGSYSTRMVDKLEVLDCPEFRLGITGATSDASYSVMLQSEIVNVLSRVSPFDLRVMKNRLTDCLTAFYAKHVWPRPGESPRMDYLLVIQPIPSGFPEVVQVSETLATVVPHPHGSVTTVGVGSHLAEYLFKQILLDDPIPVNRGASLSFLCAAGMFVAEEVKENITGVGPVERVAIFDSQGTYDELCPVDIHDIQKTFRALREYFRYCFLDAMDVESPSSDSILEESEKNWIPDIRQEHQEWYERWNQRREGRKLLGYFRDQKRNAS